MKTTLFLLSLMLIPFISISQDSNSNSDEKVSVFSEHSLLATKEIKSHLNKHIKYPESLISSDIEGTLNLSVHIMSTGKVFKVKVLKGLHPLLDRAALVALEDFQNLKDITEVYQGSPQIIVPIKFKLD